ncbi:MAG TPA: Rieske 2Fe-2S domain-containing protein, partial [Acidimicrobiales bacterium]|nr:Rieske 2Fe-2S domain-containing protein [Acidimicrobiales bacterium]
MSVDDALRSYWHPVAWAFELGGEPLSTTLLGERVVVWRDAGGHPVAAADRCPHRGTALSLGHVD